MFTKHLSGTRPSIIRALKEVDLPLSMNAPDAVRKFVTEHIPDGVGGLWNVSISCESIHNPSWDTIAGHLTVTVQRTSRT